MERRARPYPHTLTATKRELKTEIKNFFISRNDLMGLHFELVRLKLKFCSELCIFVNLLCPLLLVIQTPDGPC